MTITLSPEKIAYLNVGCGNHFSPDWNNLDLVNVPGVNQYDIRQPLPYPANSFDVVYSSHVLEHLAPEFGDQFLREQFRVLKPYGICRIAVPNLEIICRTYLHHLEQAVNTSTPEDLQDYEWSVLQLLDQLVRDKSGGRMAEALQQGLFRPEFISSLFGDEFASSIKELRPLDKLQPSKKNSLYSIARKLFRTIKPAKIVTPRETGESHRWLYDRLSLRLAMSKAGFENFAVKTHLDSDIPHWSKYNLDVSSEGNRPRKPDSIFVEGRKPQITPSLAE